MHKIADWFERRGINHTQFNAVLLVLLALVVIAAYLVGDMTPAGFLSSAATSAFNVAALLGVAFGLLFFLGGIGTKVWDIIISDPRALAITVAGLFVALALAIKG